MAIKIKYVNTPQKYKGIEENKSRKLNCQNTRWRKK